MQAGGFPEAHPESHMSRNLCSKLRLDRIPDFVTSLVIYDPFDGTVLYDHDNEEHRANPISPEILYDKLAACCTCSKRKFGKLLPHKKLPDGQKMCVYNYGVCPVNQLASLLGRHLYTTVAPQTAMLEEFTAFAKPLVTLLGDQMYDWTKTMNYDWHMHLSHYPLS